MKLIHPRPASIAGHPERFTGGVWLDEIVAGEELVQLRSYNVHFAPGGRTAWHRHPHGQVIYVTEGSGRAQEQGGPVVELRAGDTVVFAAGAWHWHGAAPERFMSHLAIQQIGEGGGDADWGEQVSDEDYRAAPAADDASG